MTKKHARRRLNPFSVVALPPTTSRPGSGTPSACTSLLACLKWLLRSAIGTEQANARLATGDDAGVTATGDTFTGTGGSGDGENCIACAVGGSPVVW